MENIEDNEEQALKVVINILHNISQHPETKVIFRENSGTQVSGSSYFFSSFFLNFKETILNNKRKSKSSQK